MLITVGFAFIFIKGFISSAVVKDENKFTGEDLGKGNKIEQKTKMSYYLYSQGLILLVRN